MNKLYVRYWATKIKRLLKQNTYYENKFRSDEPTPYIMTNNIDYNKLIYYIDKILKGK